jgi:hypothetical protein
MNKQQYREYMMSLEWAQRREAVMGRCGGMCEKDCGRRAIDVHHRTYIRVGREKLTDLIAMCRTCHQDEHGGKQFKSTRKISDAFKPFEHTNFTKATVWNSPKKKSRKRSVGGGTSHFRSW